MSEERKTSFGKMIAQRGSINLSMWAVSLKVVVDVDTNVELKIQIRAYGMEKRPTTRTVQGVPSAGLGKNRSRGKDSKWGAERGGG